MAFISDNALDAKLNYVRTNAVVIHICTSEPANFAGVAGVSLGSVAVSVGTPANGDSNGRKVVVAQFTVEATGSNDGTHWAITDDSAELLAAGPTSLTVPMTTGVEYTFAAFDLNAPDAT
jgi:hypothetical protein